jgi:branched-chain amino acid transport system substrate-binding protein
MVYPVPSGVALQIYERGYKYIFNFQPNAAEYVGKSYTGLMKNLVPADQMPKKAAVVHADDFYANAAVAGLTGKKREIAGTDKVIDLAPGTLADVSMEIVLKQQWPEKASRLDHARQRVQAEQRRNRRRLHCLTRRSDPARPRLQTIDYQQSRSPEHPSRVHDQLARRRHPHPLVVSGDQMVSARQQDFSAELHRCVRENLAGPRGQRILHLQNAGAAVAAVGSTDNDRSATGWHAADDPVKTILGSFNWDEKGLPKDKAFLITQWQGGELKFVYPVGQFPGTTDLVWPKPNW